ncbi:MAG: bifunctional N-acetylglucosamine-1-phosphate uridyltransferase/glucosamine-1-phosphate acetyltransferase [Deltaproteobacteria bacterium]|nr:bifunctional N-acetylglucosamine-1-phosphate uridyltransferase/glucosamine-1-phosphate acetyltransferase [Deltaproteobacteria bacterium]
MTVACVILAAGLGTRMKSGRAKVLHPVGGVPMIHHPVALAREVGAARVIAVLGHQLWLVKGALDARFGAGAVEVAEQREQLGTGHAVMQAVPRLEGFTGGVVILSGDVPLLRAETVGRLCAAWETAGTLAFITMRPSGAHAYGRVVRDAGGTVVRIVEHKDATPAERAIDEVNSGIYCIDAAFLRTAIAGLENRNAQGEFYLTDLVARAAAGGRAAAGAPGAEGPRVAQSSSVATIEAEPDEVMGINDRAELARADALWRHQRCEGLMRAGVTIRDPATCYLEADVEIGHDAEIGPGVVLAGRTIVGEGAIIEAGCVLRDVTVGAGARIGAHAVLTAQTVAPGATVGPLSRLTPS